MTVSSFEYFKVLVQPVQRQALNDKSPVGSIASRYIKDAGIAASRKIDPKRVQNFVGIPFQSLFLSASTAARIFPDSRRLGQLAPIMAQDPSENSDPRMAASWFLDAGFMSLTVRGRVMLHEDSGWIWKGKDEADKFVEVEIDGRCVELRMVKDGNLMRPLIAADMNAVIEEEGLTGIMVPEKRYLRNPYAKEEAPLSEKLLVFSQSVNVLSLAQTVDALKLMRRRDRLDLVAQMCRLIRRTGFADAHFGNIRFLLNRPIGKDEGVTLDLVKELKQLAVIDIEPFGLDTHSFSECAEVGLYRFKASLEDAFGGNVPEELRALIQTEIDLLRFERSSRSGHVVQSRASSSSSSSSDAELTGSTLSSGSDLESSGSRSSDEIEEFYQIEVDENNSPPHPATLSKTQRFIKTVFEPIRTMQTEIGHPMFFSPYY